MNIFLYQIADDHFCIAERHCVIINSLVGMKKKYFVG
jgi:hypothetical protein